VIGHVFLHSPARRVVPLACGPHRNGSLIDMTVAQLGHSDQKDSTDRSHRRGLSPVQLMSVDSLQTAQCGALAGHRVGWVAA
jgi:hypothetical protein